MLIRLRDLRGGAREKVTALIAEAQLPRLLPWGPAVTVLSCEDASEPDQGRHGDLLVIKIEDHEWSYLGVRDVDREGFGVAWEPEIETDSGLVVVHANPLVIPMMHPWTGHRKKVPFPKHHLGSLRREIGSVGPLEQLFSDEMRSVFPSAGLDSGWMERSAAYEVLKTLYVLIGHRRDEIDDRIPPTRG
jgi:hypothetical protein